MTLAKAVAESVRAAVMNGGHSTRLDVLAELMKAGWMLALPLMVSFRFLKLGKFSSGTKPGKLSVGLVTWRFHDGRVAPANSANSAAAALSLDAAMTGKQEPPQLAPTLAPMVHCGRPAARQSPKVALRSACIYEGPHPEDNQSASVPLSMSVNDVTETSLVPLTA